MATPKTTTTLLLDAMDDTDVKFVTKLAANAKINEELDVKDGRGKRDFMVAARGRPTITTGTNTKGTTQQKCKLEIGHSKAQTVRCIRHVSPCVIVVLVTMAGLSVHGFSTSSSPVARTSLSPLLPSPLFRQPAHHQHLVNKQQQSKFRLAVSKAHLPRKPSQDLSSPQRKNFLLILLQNFLQSVKSQVGRWPCKLKRFFIMVCAAFVFFLGVFGGPNEAGASAPPASSVVPVSRTLFSRSVDQIVEDYVKDHMFDDDVYDPVESVYREAMDDRLQGTHPKALKEITSSVLGQDVIKAEKAASGSSFGSTLVKAVGFLRQKGLSETQAIVLLTGSLVVGTPTIAFAVLMMLGAQNKRSINRLMKKRYGETYTVDATIKVEEDVEAPVDDEDEEDDDEDEEENK